MKRKFEGKEQSNKERERERDRDRERGKMIFLLNE